MAETIKGRPSGAPADLPADDKQETFFSRWSRLTEETRQPPSQQTPEKAADPNAAAPELTPLDKLTFDSDYRAFFHPKVDEEVRRAALKKLFSDPRFNLMDGLDVYIDDYSKSEPIPPAMLAGLRQAQKILGWAQEKKAEDRQARNDLQERTPAAEAEPQALTDQTAPPTPVSTPPAVEQRASVERAEESRATPERKS